MRIWKFSLIPVIIVTLTWFYYLPATETSCAVGIKTSLIGKECVNVWTGKNPKFRWPDLNARCNPNHPLCDSIKNNPPMPLRLADCGDAQILDLLPEDHLAKIQCKSLEPEQSKEFFINIDSLSCNYKNVLRYEKPSSPLITSSNQIGNLLLDKAERRMKEIQNEINHDDLILLAYLESSDPKRLFNNIKDAHSEIGDLLLQVCEKMGFNITCEPVDGTVLTLSHEIRAQRTCRLLKVTFDNGINLFKYINSRFPAGFKANDVQKGLAMKRALNSLDLFEGKYNQTDALSIRMLMFYALRKDIWDLADRLKLIRRSEETGVHDPSHPDSPFFFELHAGFVFGGRRLNENSGGGYDCTDFITSLIMNHEADGKVITTQGLKTIARHLSGESSDRLSDTVRSLESCFSFVDVRGGMVPKPGDIIISNSETFHNGHAAIVKRYILNQSITTYEAVGGRINAILNKTRPLFEPQPGCDMQEPRLPMRSDLYLLRIKDPLPTSCSLSISEQ
jgi:hypothetical protein